MSKSLEAKEQLKELLKKGDTVYTILDHVSRSGMQRVIRLKIIKNNKPVDITCLVSKALDYPINKKHDGLTVGGVGMDMGFHVVYALSACLYGYDNRGAYTLNQSWL